MAKTAKIHNPQGRLMVVNPWSKTMTRRKKRNTSKRRATSSRSRVVARKNPTRSFKRVSRRRRNPSILGGGEIGKMVTQGIATGVGAVVTTLVCSFIPLPTSPLLNAVAKSALGAAIGYGAGFFGPAKPYAAAIGAGGISLGVIDGLRNVVPQVRTLYASQIQSLPPAQQQQVIDAELGDVVYDEGFGDVIDSLAFDSQFS